MKPFAVIATIMFSTVCGFAQDFPGYDKMTLGGYGILSIPAGDFADAAGTGYGGGAKFQYSAAPNAAFTATVGYVAWGKKEFAFSSTESSAWEILIGGKFYFVSGFYGQLEGGVNFFSVDATVTTPGAGSGVAGTASETRFMLPFGFGYQYGAFEVAAKYYLFHPDANSFGFTLGYNASL